MTIAERLLCAEPISTGITDGRPTFEPCGRELHGELPMCKAHALEAGLLRRESPPSAPWLSNIGEAAGRRPRVLIACERSGIVRDAFRAAGCDAFSCDTEAAESPSPYHMRGDVRPVLRAGGWDLVIAHPPCTYLASSGLHWNRRRPERAALTEAALEFVRELMATCEQIGARYAIENPIGCISTRIRKPDQIVQPWQFGDDASKATCLWLSGLPQLQPTNVLPGGRLARRANQTASGQNRLGPSPERAYLRAKTYPGIAEAMARQWALVIAHKYPPTSVAARPARRRRRTPR